MVPSLLLLYLYEGDGTFNLYQLMIPFLLEGEDNFILRC